MKKDKLSVFISLVLRHKPDTIGITLDKHGWTNVDELINGINKSGRNINMEVLEEIVKTDDKQRYSFNEDKTLIRANQGHSVLVDVELKEMVPPDILYHGTATRFLDSIRQHGIKSMSRLYVHLSKDVETAIKVGDRHGECVVLEIDAKKMHEDGIKFYLSENGVWLTKFVNWKYVITRRLIMNNITIMSIPCGFKIKSKVDVERFINECMVKDNEYFLKIHEDFALVLRKEKDGTVSVLEKRWYLYDVFNPLLEVANTSNNGYKKTVHYYIWKYRNYINAEWFNN